MTENERLREALQFVLDNLVTRSAGTIDSPFAYIWTDKWDEFEKMANEALEGEK